jgi:ABC-type lipoprotein release transport system permease subunit
MILKNLFRRRGRTTLTLLGIAIGVMAIVALGAMAQGLKAGFAAMSQGSRADLVLSQGESLTALMSSVDETIADPVRGLPGVAGVDGMLYTNALIDGRDYLLIFGYDPEGFAVDRFRIVDGQALADARGVRGKPLILGRQAAQSMNLSVGDTLRITGSAFRVIGIYETGSGLEDGGAVVSLEEAQALALQPRRVSVLYIRLDDPGQADLVRARIERRYPDLAVATSAEFADQEQLFGLLDTVAMAVAGLAVVIGGITMANTLLMSVFERTHEIGVLRSLGWRRRRVMGLILGEALVLALLGGLAGSGLGLLVLVAVSRSRSPLGVVGSQLTPGIFLRALVTVLALGLGGGAYPAWWASRLLPVEALQYEGGARGPRAGRDDGAQLVAAADTYLADPVEHRSEHRRRRRAGRGRRGHAGLVHGDHARQPDRPVRRRGGRGHGLFRDRRAGGGAAGAAARHSRRVGDVLDGNDDGRRADADRVRLSPARVRDPPLPDHRGRPAGGPPRGDRGADSGGADERTRRRHDPPL